jgi:molecular chaperone GrpE
VESRKIPINSSEPSKKEEEPFRVVDKRPFFEAGDTAPSEGTREEHPRYPSFVEELLERVNETERRFAERVKLVDQEIARSKVRLEAEYERKLALAKQDILLPFLEVLDNLERALQAASAGSKEDLMEGVNLTAALFHAKLRAQGVEPIAVLDQPFDPNLSQAVGVVAVNEPAKDGLVVDELLPGYRMGDNLLRPAQVRVGQHRG